MPQMSAEEALASIQAIIIYILMRVVHSAPRPNIPMLGTMKASVQLPNPLPQPETKLTRLISIIGPVRSLRSIASWALQPTTLATVPTKLGRVDFGGITEKVGLVYSSRR